jgi:transcriptional regulator with XRE-family HTH domain
MKRSRADPAAPLPRNLSRFRKRLGWTTDDLAAATSRVADPRIGRVGGSTIRRIESEKVGNPGILVIAALADA